MLEVLLKAIEVAVQRGDTVSGFADYEYYAARAFGPSFDITFGVDRVDHRLYASATKRTGDMSESWWRSDSDKLGYRFIYGLTLAKSLGDPLLVAALEDPVDPDDEVEVSARAKLVATLLPLILERVRIKASG